MFLLVVAPVNKRIDERCAALWLSLVCPEHFPPAVGYLVAATSALDQAHLAQGIGDIIGERGSHRGQRHAKTLHDMNVCLFPAVRQYAEKPDLLLSERHNKTSR